MILLNFSAAVEAPQLVEMFPAYYIFNGLLSILLVLHVIWTYFILKMAYFSVYAKEVYQPTYPSFKRKDFWMIKGSRSGEILPEMFSDKNSFTPSQSSLG